MNYFTRRSVVFIKTLREKKMFAAAIKMKEKLV
jgi:hypothetical protein